MFANLTFLEIVGKSLFDKKVNVYLSRITSKSYITNLPNIAQYAISFQISRK